MDKLNDETEELRDSVVHTYAIDNKEMRIIDRCRHYLGKMLEGNVYIYCTRCKKFVIVHKHL